MFQFALLFLASASAPTNASSLPARARDCLAEFTAPPAASTRARDMTLDEARDAVVALVRDGVVKLFERKVTFDRACKILYPRATDRLDIAETIAGVALVYGPVDRPTAYPTRRLDHRHTVALARLAEHLKAKWGAMAIRHLGISAGKGGNNAHNSGRAIDLASVIGTRDGVAYTIDVWRDWGRKPRLSRKARSDADFPRYRLLPRPHVVAAKTPALRGATNPGRPDPYALFLDIYEFAAREYSDSSTKLGKNGEPTEIGTTSYVLHPDHPYPALAWDHRDHFHLQIGPARGEGRPPRSPKP